MMKRSGLSIGALLGAILAFVVVPGGTCAARRQSGPQTNLQTKPRREAPPQTPSAEEIQQSAKTLIENQHRNDLALDEYERIERHQDFTTGANPEIIEDKVYRVVPDGGGTMKILVKDKGTPTDPADYRRQLQLWEDILQRMTQPGDSKAKAARDKFEKRQRDRADFVDAAGKAFVIKWAGQEMQDGHNCDVFVLTPNPDFHPRTMFQSALAHVTAKIWVAHDADQLVRGEANVLSDISFGGGLLGKLYRGSSVSIEQTQIAPGIWLPTRTEYDFSGRKFLFPFAEHQVIEAGHYRRIGSPQAALAMVQNELATGKTFSEDP